MIIEPDDPTILFNLACGLTRIGYMERALDVPEMGTRKASLGFVNHLEHDSGLAPLQDHRQRKAAISVP